MKTLLILSVSIEILVYTEEGDISPCNQILVTCKADRKYEMFCDIL